MLYATLNEDGDLVITASESIEVYALEAWERARKQGKAKVVISNGVRLSITEIAEKMKQSALEFRRWQAWMKTQEGTTLTTREEAKLIAGD